MNKKKIDELVREFPFLSGLIKGWPEIKTMVKSIKVSVADKETLFLKPRFFTGTRWVNSDDNKLVGHISPRMYVVDEYDKIMASKPWNYDMPEWYAKDLLIMSYPRTANKLVLVLTNNWWNYIEDFHQKGLKSYVGDFSHTEKNIWIYKSPKEGFLSLIQKADLSSNVLITDPTGLALSSTKIEDAERAWNKVLETVEIFQNKIGKDLWTVVNKGKISSQSGVLGSVELKTLNMAGRIMIMLSKGNRFISMVGDESNWRRTGPQLMYATVDEARAIVDEAVANWSPKKIKPDHNVWLG